MLEEWEEKLEWPQRSLYIRNAKRAIKSGLFESLAPYIFTGGNWCNKMIKTDLSASFVNIAFAVLFVVCTVLHAVFLQIAVQKIKSGNNKRVHWSSKINQYFKSFSSRLEANFPALIVLFPISKIWKITQNTEKVSFNFKCLSAQWQRRTLECQMYFLTLMISHSDDSLQLW